MTPKMLSLMRELREVRRAKGDGRDQFEEWFKFHHGEEGSIVTLHRANGGANYADPHVDLAWIAWKDSRAAMLNHSGDTADMVEPVSNRDELPATQFKPVADLYGITSPTGSETSFTFDAIEAANFIEGGWSVQEYVELERYQEAMIGNSPATSDGWVMVPMKLTAENGAKAALIGEFNLEYTLTCHECFGEGCDDCSGEGAWINTIPIDWTTIKEIWAKGVEHFSVAPQEAKGE
jgi:hypothetical protein